MFGVAKGENEIARLGCLTGGVKDRAAVGFEDLQPVAEVIGVAHLWYDAELRAQERARQFGYQFFARVGFGAETVLQVACEARGVRRPVAVMPISA